MPASKHLEGPQNPRQRTDSACQGAQVSLVWGQQGPEGAENQLSTHSSRLTAGSCTRLCLLMVLTATVWR